MDFLSICEKPSEMALVFLLVCAGGLLAGLELAWLVHGWRTRNVKPRPAFWPFVGERADKALTLSLNAAVLAAVLAVLYGRFVEPGWIEVASVELRSEKIRPGTGRLRIVHLSDIHSERYPLNEEKAVGLVRELKPDLIAVTGDYLNDRAGLPVLRRLLSGLAGTAPVFLVTGNVDIGFLPDAAFDGMPVMVLRKEWRELEVRGTTVRVFGMAVRDESLFPVLARKLPKKPVFDVFLHHYADSVYEADKAGTDLYLSGHTHGGQIRLPFYGGLMTGAKFGKRFEAGLYRVGRTALYVSRGLGMEVRQGHPFRFLCRPEIAVLDVSRAGGT